MDVLPLASGQVAIIDETAVFLAGSPIAITLLVGAPDDYAALIAPVPNGLTFATTVSGTTDIVHVFATRRAELRTLLSGCRRKLKSTAAIWVSWPKKSSRVPTEVTEDVIRELALPMGFVDVKVCAVTEVWSGLKLVLRKELR